MGCVWVDVGFVGGADLWVGVHVWGVGVWEVWRYVVGCEGGCGGVGEGVGGVRVCVGMMGSGGCVGPPTHTHIHPMMHIP